ncbi:VIT1/CCC1 transporter family protein [Stakelama marina]|uniref:VIT family protein n=1 Tax=Stakelama marina TaxID=2826939 RepID=A0A8T4IE76_9SPHN|nr:VIT family protein [Stakelama marina]MBR0552154.1 VIT family protein [Stakelama marina]
MGAELSHHSEKHLVHRINWLRAAVLGANDGIVSTASLITGVAAAGSDRHSILLSGIAGLVAGAMSMAAGEYVSVSSQSDAEAADTAKEAFELERNPEAERRELAAIYRGRGLSPDLALQVADQLSAHDALGAHLRDELGIHEATAARPVQAALASAASFAAGALPPVLLVLVMPLSTIAVSVVLLSLFLLATLGALGARTGGAEMGRAAWRVTLWGALAMGITAAVGALVGTQL